MDNIKTIESTVIKCVKPETEYNISYAAKVTAALNTRKKHRGNRGIRAKLQSLKDEETQRKKIKQKHAVDPVPHDTGLIILPGATEIVTNSRYCESCDSTIYFTHRRNNESVYTSVICSECGYMSCLTLIRAYS